MNNRWFFRILFFSFCSVFAVDDAYSQQVVNAAGNYLIGNAQSVEYSLGEVVIHTLTGNGRNITQGLIQPGYNQAVSIYETDARFKCRVFPMPVSTKLYIESDYAGLVSYELVSLSGMNIESGLVTGTILDLNHLHSGMYFLRLRGDEGFMFVTKIIKL
jgi:hypothetical protein